MNLLIKQYIPVANLIAMTFGKECEVVLHDLTTPEKSVIYTVNNHVTGRQVGQSFDHIITHVLLSQNFENDCLANYYFKSSDNRLIKSSTLLIRDSDNKVMGAICINIDTTVTTQIMEWLSEKIPLAPDINEPMELSESKVIDMEHISDIADDLIEKIVGARNVSEMKRDEKISLISFMEQKGVFLIRGSIEKVAEKLGISKVTVYSYIDELKAK